VPLGGQGRIRDVYRATSSGQLRQFLLPMEQYTRRDPLVTRQACEKPDIYRLSYFIPCFQKTDRCYQEFARKYLRHGLFQAPERPSKAKKCWIPSKFPC
jgi:hypothetical protein